MLITLGFPSGTWKPYESKWKQPGSSQDGSWSVFSVQEEPQEVAEVLPAAAKKGSKVQLRLCSCRASRIFASFPQSATIRPIYSAFMWFVKQASMAPMFLKVQKEPSVKMEAPTAAEACFGMHHCATDLTEACRRDDQCDNATDCHCMSWIFFCQLGIVRNRIEVNVDHMLITCWSLWDFHLELGSLTKAIWVLSSRVLKCV